MAQGESKRSRQIMRHLEITYPGLFCFKVHGSALMMVGLPDIIGCVEGYFFAFETKLDTTPKKRQLWVQSLIRRAGGLSEIVHTKQEAAGHIERLLRKRRSGTPSTVGEGD